jgi:hypothetical protein
VNLIVQARVFDDALEPRHPHDPKSTILVLEQGKTVAKPAWKKIDFTRIAENLNDGAIIENALTTWSM